MRYMFHGCVTDLYGSGDVSMEIGHKMLHKTKVDIQYVVVCIHFIFGVSM